MCEMGSKKTPSGNRSKCRERHKQSAKDILAPQPAGVGSSKTHHRRRQHAAKQKGVHPPHNSNEPSHNSNGDLNDHELPFHNFDDDLDNEVLAPHNLNEGVNDNDLAPLNFDDELHNNDPLPHNFNEDDEQAEIPSHSSDHDLNAHDLSLYTSDDDDEQPAMQLNDDADHLNNADLTSKHLNDQLNDDDLTPDAILREFNNVARLCNSQITGRKTSLYPLDNRANRSHRSGPP